MAGDSDWSQFELPNNAAAEGEAHEGGRGWGGFCIKRRRK